MNTSVRRRARGFSMMEVLVGIMVVSFGMLAVAALQVQTLRLSHESGLRTIASWQAQSMADLVRANRVLANTNTLPTSGTTDPNCYTTVGCAPPRMFVAQLNQWNQANGNWLPSGAGVVCRDSTPDDGTPAAPACDGLGGPNWVVKIWWNADRDGTLSRYTMVFRP